MKKLLLLYFLVFKTLLFGCAACQLMIPTAEINIDVHIDKKRAQNIHLQWNFSDMYTSQILIQYDQNNNQVLDKKELDAVLKAMLDYMLPKEMLTKIKYAKESAEDGSLIKPKYKNFDLKVKDGFLIFTYDAALNIDIEDKSTLSLIFEDNEGFFGFVVTDLKVDKNDLYYKENIYLFTTSILFSHTPFETKQDEQVVKKDVVKETPKIKQENVKEPQESSAQANILKESIIKIKSLFESIKDEKNPLTYLLLLLFAYVYGLIHALGPGHGKTLVASYFLSNEKSYSRALFVSLAIGVVHTFSAFLLTLIIYFAVNTFLSQFLNDTVFYTTKISAVIIISIALYLLYQKYKAYKNIQEAKKQPSFNFSTTPHVSTCSCAACKVDEKSTDLALIVSAGIIPCPGTVTIFIFSLSLGLYYAGFLSALVMSLGMSTIIFFSAVLSVAVRKKTSEGNGNLKKYLEYGSLVIILLLGLLLLFT